MVLKVGDKVEILSNGAGSKNAIGEYGFVVAVKEERNYSIYKVHVTGTVNIANFHLYEELKLIKEGE